MKLPPPLLENFRYQNSFETQVFSYEFYRHCETKIFQRSLVKNSTERFPPMKFFGTETKIFDGKSWYSPLPLIHTLFRYQKFSETEHRRVPLWNFSALWDQNFSTEKRDTPLSDASIFWIPEVFRYTEVLHNEIFRYCETKKLRWKNVIPLFHP